MNIEIGKYYDLRVKAVGDSRHKGGVGFETCNGQWVHEFPISRDAMIEAPEFECGDEVEVCDNIHNRWLKRRYIGKHNEMHVCVAENYQDQFNDGDDEYKVVEWQYCRKIKAPLIEITCKINGKPCLLSDISKETLLQIRGKS